MKVRFSEDRVFTPRYANAPEMAERHWSDFLDEPFRKIGLSWPAVMLRLVPVDTVERS